MKAFFKNNRTLWISFLITLVAALLTVSMIACAVMPVTGTVAIKTVAAAGGFRWEDDPDEQPSKDDTIEKVLADRSVNAWQEAQNRRRCMDDGVIPETGSDWHSPYTGWEEVALPETEQTETIRMANMWMRSLIGLSLREPVTILAWSDPKGYRPDYIQVRDVENETIISMVRETYALINLDTARTDGRVMTRTDADAVGKDLLSALGLTGKANAQVDYTGREYLFTTTDTDVVGIGTVNDRIASVRVYENMACVEEHVYWSADLQNHADFVEAVSETDFVPATEADLLQKNPSAMTEDEARSLFCLLWKQATGEEITGSTMELHAFADRSGRREDYWQVTGTKGISAILSAESGLLIRFESDGLDRLDGGNPPAQTMIADENDENAFQKMERIYIDYVKERFVPWFEALARGQERGQVKNVSINAIYDFYYATVDVTLNDGTVYELMFDHGALKEIQYYFSEYAFWGDIPWGRWSADALYRNTVTDEEFYGSGLYW